MIKSILGGKSKNLFDISKADVVIHGDMSFSSNVSYNSHFYSIPVEAGQTYTVSYDIYAVAGGGLQIALSCQTGDFYQDGVLLFKQLTPNNSINNWTHITNTFTIPSGATKITFSSLKYPDYPKYFRNFQIEKGSTATEYVPHELTSYKSIMKVSEVCQLGDKRKYNPTETNSGVTFTNNGDGTITVNGTSTQMVGFYLQGINFIENHTYLLIGCPSGGSNSTYILDTGADIGNDRGNGTISKPKLVGNRYFSIYVYANTTCNNLVFKPQLFDLTEMFGAGNEPKTVAEFKAKFPNDYYPYSPSCFVTSFDERMPCKTKNLFDIDNAVPFKFNNENPPSSQVSLKDRIYTTTVNNFNFGSGLKIKGKWVLPAGSYVIKADIVDFSATATFGIIGWYYNDIDGKRYYSSTRIIKPKIGMQASTTPFNIPEGIQDFRVYLSWQNNTPDIVGFISYKDIQVMKSDITATDYVPYGYV